MSPKKLFKLAIGTLFTSFCLWLIFRQTNISEIRSAFRDANTLLIAMALFVFMLGYTLRIERWRMMLVNDNHLLKWRHVTGPFLASIAVNNILPFRAGDILRAFGFNQKLNINAATAVSSLFVERLLDLLVLISILGIALTYFGMETSRFFGVSGSILFSVSMAIFLILFFPSFFEPFARALLCNLVAKVFPRLGEKLLIELEKCYSSFKYMARKGILARLIGLSLLVWCAEGVVFLLAAYALPSISNALAACVAFPIGTLSTTIPSTPGYVGTFDFFTAKAMTIAGNPFAAAAAYSILVHVLLWLPPTIVGGIYLLLVPINIRKRPKEA